MVVEVLPDPRAARSFLLSSRFVRTLDGYHLVNALINGRCAFRIFSKFARNA